MGWVSEWEVERPGILFLVLSQIKESRNMIFVAVSIQKFSLKSPICFASSTGSKTPVSL